MRLKSFFALSVLFGGTFAAAQVSFTVPATHPKYAMLDSMYRAAEALGQSAKAKELKLIRTKKVRAGNLETKAAYLKAAVEQKLADSASVLTYFQTSLAQTEALEAYFKELLTVLEGNDRVDCVNMARGTRAKKETLIRLVEKYKPSEEPVIRGAKLKLDLGE